MPPGRKRLDPATKAEHRRETLRRYAEKYYAAKQGSTSGGCSSPHAAAASDSCTIASIESVHAPKVSPVRCKISRAVAIAKLFAWPMPSGEPRNTLKLLVSRHSTPRTTAGSWRAPNARTRDGPLLLDRAPSLTHGPNAAMFHLPPNPPIPPVALVALKLGIALKTHVAPKRCVGVKTFVGLKSTLRLADAEDSDQDDRAARHQDTLVPFGTVEQKLLPVWARPLCAC
ncbi:hypothetical protein B0H11DRAFT_2256163 [Mycena galericulata]|nr:hypothetical protein B0H11DRAFT_2256163 [Mycena galericulata]